MTIPVALVTGQPYASPIGTRRAGDNGGRWGEDAFKISRPHFTVVGAEKEERSSRGEPALNSSVNVRRAPSSPFNRHVGHRIPLAKMLTKPDQAQFRLVQEDVDADHGSISQKVENTLQDGTAFLNAAIP